MIRPVRNPGAVIQDAIREAFLEESFRACGQRGRLLDLGCATKPFEPLYARYATSSVGIDVPTSQHGRGRVDVVATGLALPFDREAFDLVLCTEVMEHVPEPRRLLDEIRRVLRPGGVAIMTTPFLVPEHEQPHDFYRFTRYGLRYLAEQAGLEVVELRPFAGMAGTCISFLVQAQLKAWDVLAKAVRWRGLRSLWNPLVLLFVHAPQVAYLAALRAAERLPRVRRALDRLSYTAKGYGVLLRKR